MTRRPSSVVRRPSSIVSLVFAVAALVAHPTAGSHAPIVVEVSALDPKGEPVAQFGTADVEVVVDGTAVPVQSVTRAPTLLQTVLVVDATSSQPLKRSEMIGALGTQWLGSLIK